MGAPESKPPFEHYFSLWRLTAKGLNDPETLKETFGKASAMIRKLGGRCHLYLAVGGDCDFIGVAAGEKINDVSIMEIQQAIKGFGTLETTFIKARELSLNDLAKFVAGVKDFRKIKPVPIKL